MNHSANFWRIVEARFIPTGKRRVRDELKNCTTTLPIL
jgi:predicted metal-dependent hydrolase